MACGVCSDSYDLGDRIPLVLQCGHTYCRSCLQRLASPVRCPRCRAQEPRTISTIPKNFQLVEDLRLELAGQFNGLGLSSSSSKNPVLSRLWLDEQELELSSIVLGSGAAGQVVAGTYEGREVAVKVVDLSEAPAAIRQALRREAEVVLRVSGECRHACQYKGATIKANKFCLVMKRYSKSLARVIADDGAAPNSLPLPRILRYGTQTLAALHELHSQSVVLMDLKPQNLLLEEALDELVVTDFGLSKVVSHTLGGFRASTVGCGTPNYMPPEQHTVDADSNPEPPTPAIDMWAWACTMIHMATGSPPFPNLRDHQIMMHVGVQKRSPPIPSSLREPLRQLLSRCLAVEPWQRPSALQALQDLKAVHSATPHAAAAPRSRTSPAIAGVPGAFSLVELLGSNNSRDVQEAAARALRNLAYGNAANKAAIAAVPGALSSLVALLGSNNSSCVQEEAAGALQSLAYVDQLQAAIAAVPGALSSLVALLGSNNSSSVQEAAAGAMRNLAYGNGANMVAIAGVPGAFSSLVELLGSNNSSKVQEAAAGALANLASNNAANKAAIASVPGALSSVVALLGSSNSSGVQEAAAGALRTLAYDYAISKAIAAVPGALSSLVALLESSNSSGVQVAAAGALRILAYDDAIVKAIAAVPGALSSLMALLGSNNRLSVREAAAGALRNLESDNLSD